MVVLDSWALLAYLKNEPAAERIEAEWLARGAAVSAINLGEAFYIRIREHGGNPATAEIETLREVCTVVDPDWQLVTAAAEIKARGGLAYADAFCIATAESLGASLWTGDPEIIGLADQFSCAVIDLRTADI